jgi:hypothetical protein
VLHDGTAWHEDVEFDFGRHVPAIDLARTSVFSYGDRTLVLYSYESEGPRTRWRVKDIAPTPAIRLAEFELYTGDLGEWEPTYDTRALAELHMLITPLAPNSTGTGGTSDLAFASRWGGILSLDIDDLDALSSEGKVAPIAGPVTHWIPAALGYSTAGSPIINGGGAPAWQFNATCSVSSLPPLSRRPAGSGSAWTCGGSMPVPGTSSSTPGT